MENPTASSSISPPSSSPITFSSSTEPDPSSNPQPTSASNSLTNSKGGILSSSEQTTNNDAEFGFQRAEMGQASLVGTVQIYERHLFLCYKTPGVWPSHVEASESDRLPRLLAAALKSRVKDIKKKTRLTICEGEDGTESSNGDVLIFPDMIRYRRLTHFDVDNFVEDVLVKETEWLPGAGEVLTGSYVFVCAHGSRDRRCGVCGPVLIDKFKEEISSRGLQGNVSVSPCSHVGGHKYAGNVIIFSQNAHGEVTGHWYGYVTPDDVPLLLEHHIGKGEIVDHLWRGQMGLSEEDQKKAQQLRLQLNGTTQEKVSQGPVEATESIANGSALEASGCCQGRGNVSCCQNGTAEEKLEKNCEDEQKAEDGVTKKSSKQSKGKARKICGGPKWFQSWEREDTYAALAVVAAVASVAVAYSCYRQLK
ncbi:uncharacterized protein A4U43_C01F5420 [Asparagus officinalis]|uniref:Uncharacterized protein n=1 Tax=Asparagus officinalis TaxID=4686 RepID=A0A5P1FM02_ASPOF|nr:altered inheritance of mitochondria protein 32 [Asparagus officinalis]ONK79345.1 uncharacterized protein A4U43_C01F5420 [Asparagus officinalis]